MCLLLHDSLNQAAADGAERRTHTFLRWRFLFRKPPLLPLSFTRILLLGQSLSRTLTCDLGEERWMCLDAKVETKAAKKKNAQHTVNRRVGACGVDPDSTRRCEAVKKKKSHRVSAVVLICCRGRSFCLLNVRAN